MGKAKRRLTAKKASKRGRASAKTVRKKMAKRGALKKRSLRTAEKMAPTKARMASVVEEAIIDAMERAIFGAIARFPKVGSFW